MMKNQELIRAFVRGTKSGIRNGSMSVSSDGGRLYSYNTVIAEKRDGNVLVNRTKYSVTTSKHQCYLDLELSRAGASVIECGCKYPMGCDHLNIFNL